MMVLVFLYMKDFLCIYTRTIPEHLCVFFFVVIQGRFISERKERKEAENPYLQVYGFHYEVETTTAKRRSLEEYLLRMVSW